MKKSILIIFVLVAFGICAAFFVSTSEKQISSAFISERYEGINIEEFSGIGDSMIPLIKSGTMINIQRIPYKNLKSGMVVVYKKDQFVYVCHVLVRETVNGWVAKGTNNEYEDDTFVVDSNYMGVVVK